MSSTGQATSSTPSTSTIQLITNALADYTKITGVHLLTDPLAAEIRQLDSPEAFLELLKKRENLFKQYRDNSRRIINCLTPAVRIIQTFSGILGEMATLVSNKYDPLTHLNGLSQVPFPPAKAVFVGIDVLLAVRPFEIDSLSSSFVMYQHDRLLVGLHLATMLFSSCSIAWATSLSVSKSIRLFPPLP
jgi:hypothetical protein